MRPQTGIAFGSSEFNNNSSSGFTFGSTKPSNDNILSASTIDNNNSSKPSGFTFQSNVIVPPSTISATTTTTGSFSNTGTSISGIFPTSIIPEQQTNNINTGFSFGTTTINNNTSSNNSNSNNNNVQNNTVGRARRRSRK